MKDGFVVEILRPAGVAICRLHLRRRDLVAICVALSLVCGGLVTAHFVQLHAAAVAVSRLQAERADERRKIATMEREAQALQRQNAESERSIERIELTLGARRSSNLGRIVPLRATLGHAEADAALAARFRALRLASARTRLQAHRLATLAARILNVRRLAAIARARTLAAIPSLDPVSGEISAGFGWRTNPWPEFHKGLDLAADYGTPVHAAAAGIVSSAGWAGDYGIRVDIDHGNGYHTWYCHLSRVVVGAGERVEKGTLIAAVGSTGESTGPHLHYQVMHDGVAIDPFPFLHGVPANVMASLPADSDVH
jgi:murein DD-endopeptidase MepM/ murein hydrolase activator NlpD